MAEPLQATVEPAAPARSLRATLIRSAAHFSVATFASQASGVLRSILVMRLLGPAATGVWMALQLIIAYGASAHLGAVNGMHRHVPLLRGRGDDAGAEEVKRTTFTFTLLAGLACFLAVAAATFGAFDALARPFERLRDLLAHLQEPEVRGVALAVGAVLPLTLIRGYYVVLLRAENRFRESSQASIASSVTGVLTILLIKPFGLAGVVWGVIALVGVETVWLMACAGVPRLSLRGSVLRDQLAVGLLTVSGATVGTLFSSIDRTVLLEHFPADPRGHYQPAVLLATFFAGLAQVPNAVLYPRLSERFGRSGQPRDLVPLVGTPMRLVATGFALLSAMTVVAAPSLLRIALPQYVAGTTALQIAVWGVAIYSAVGVVANAFLALNRQWLYLGLLGVSTAIAYGSTEALVARWHGLPAIAAGSAIGYLAFGVAVVGVGWTLMEQRPVEALRATARMLWPIAWGALCAGAIVAGLGRLIAPDSLLFAACGELLLLAAFVPAALPALRELKRSR